jgi:DNA-binding MarR family transcriptional regulator
LPSYAPAPSGWVPCHPRTMFYLNEANHAVRSRLEQALRHLEVTGIQYTVLSVIGAREGLSSAELSRRFYVTPQTMNELINGLERRKLIARKEDPANRRILKMRLTASGRKLLAECNEVADRVEMEVFSGMPRESYEQLRTLTRMLARTLREPDGGVGSTDTTAERAQQPATAKRRSSAPPGRAPTRASRGSVQAKRRVADPVEPRA